MFEKPYLSPRRQPKISLRHDHNWTKGMINRVLQLNNSQLENSFNSLLEKHLVLNFPNQPNPNPIQSVIDRGNLRTQNVCLCGDKGKTSRSHEIDDKRLHKKLGSSDKSVMEQGNL